MTQYEQLALRLLHHIARTLEEQLRREEGNLGEEEGPLGENAKRRREEFNSLTKNLYKALEIK